MIGRDGDRRDGELDLLRREDIEAGHLRDLDAQPRRVEHGDGARREHASARRVPPARLRHDRAQPLHEGLSRLDGVKAVDPRVVGERHVHRAHLQRAHDLLAHRDACAVEHGRTADGVDGHDRQRLDDATRDDGRRGHGDVQRLDGEDVVLLDGVEPQDQVSVRDAVEDVGRAQQVRDDDAVPAARLTLRRRDAEEQVVPGRRGVAERRGDVGHPCVVRQVQLDRVVLRRAQRSLVVVAEEDARRHGLGGLIDVDEARQSKGGARGVFVLDHGERRLVVVVVVVVSAAASAAAATAAAGIGAEAAAQRDAAAAPERTSRDQRRRRKVAREGPTRHGDVGGMRRELRHLGQADDHREVRRGHVARAVLAQLVERRISDRRRAVVVGGERAHVADGRDILDGVVQRDARVVDRARSDAARHEARIAVRRVCDRVDHKAAVDDAAVDEARAEVGRRRRHARVRGIGRVEQQLEQCRARARRGVDEAVSCATARAVRRFVSDETRVQQRRKVRERRVGAVEVEARRVGDVAAVGQAHEVEVVVRRVVDAQQPRLDVIEQHARRGRLGLTQARPPPVGAFGRQAERDSSSPRDVDERWRQRVGDQGAGDGRGAAGRLEPHRGRRDHRLRRGRERGGRDGHLDGFWLPDGIRDRRPKRRQRQAQRRRVEHLQRQVAQADRHLDAQAAVRRVGARHVAVASELEVEDGVPPAHLRLRRAHAHHDDSSERIVRRERGRPRVGEQPHLERAAGDARRVAARRAVGVEQVASERRRAGRRSHHKRAQAILEGEVVVEEGGGGDGDVHRLRRVDAVGGQRRDRQRQMRGVVSARAQQPARRQLPAARASSEADVLRADERTRERVVRGVARPPRVERPLAAAQHQLQRVRARAQLADGHRATDELPENVDCGHAHVEREVGVRRLGSDVICCHPVRRADGHRLRVLHVEGRVPSAAVDAEEVERELLAGDADDVRWREVRRDRRQPAASLIGAADHLARQPLGCRVEVDAQLRHPLSALGPAQEVGACERQVDILDVARSQRLLGQLWWADYQHGRRRRRSHELSGASEECER